VGVYRHPRDRTKPIAVTDLPTMTDLFHRKIGTMSDRLTDHDRPFTYSFSDDIDIYYKLLEKVGQVGHPVRGRSLDERRKR